MIRISLSPLELSALADRLGEACACYKPSMATGKMVHACLLELFQKLHSRTAFPKPQNRFTLSAPQALAFFMYFKNNQYRGELADILIAKIVGMVHQKM
jgi:hypothetical protein